MKKLYILSIISCVLSVLSLSSGAHAGSCSFSVEPSSVTVHWIAFKTTEKLAVQGTLKDVSVKLPSKAPSSLSQLLQSLQAKGKVDHESKSDSGNPGRDLTLFQKYFSLIKNQAAFAGKFSGVKGNDQAGQLNLTLEFNSKKKSVPMNYVLNDQGDLEVSGEFNMLDFGLSAALDSIHQACEVLHKGKDGVSKTWPDVGLKIKAKVNRDCAKK